ncbi:prepilin-type N-terminal cleavage/methylation domain-containing protein [Lachnospiraceae bacterium NE2001]|nr:prepilin-type N-terminal cleavage/methylation domain-containing protein [Lachnospiraceae bacterium NE2001]
MKKNNKGFTLVELIVVLVILAILAAILVPALLGYIDKARTSQYEEEAHSILVAIQGYETEQYAKKASDTGVSYSAIEAYVNPIVSPTKITGLETIYVGTGSSNANADHEKFTVSGLKNLAFTSSNGNAIVCSFDGASWVITKVGTEDKDAVPAAFKGTPKTVTTTNN